MKIEKCKITDFSPEEYERFFARMSPERQAKALRFKNEDDRKRCVAADALARRMISEKCGKDEEKIIFAEDENGKPYAENAEIRFNVSHSGIYVICALSEKPVGADIEKISKAALHALPRFADEIETEFVGGSEEKATLLWTLKEAYLKAGGTGIAGGLGSVRFYPEGGKLACSDKSCEFTSEIIDGYIISVCEKNE